MKQMEGFTAAKYDPQSWAALIKESGARYAVLTTKHHDGVALWPTKEKHWSVLKNTPAKRDLLKPFYDALDAQGIKRGAYYSLIDWSHPDYPGFLKDSNRYTIAGQPARWKKFQAFNEAQINEINKAYKPDLWWFDGDWEHSRKSGKAKNCGTLSWRFTPRQSSTGGCRVMEIMIRRNRIFLLPAQPLTGGSFV
jgi:alpha-L-fucosidase